MSRHEPQENQGLSPEQAFMVAFLQRVLLDARRQPAPRMTQARQQRQDARAFLHDPDGACLCFELLGIDRATVTRLLGQAAA